MIRSGAEPTFELRHVCKKYGSVTALDDVSLQFEAGRRYALIGPNGSGKTTLLRLLAGRIAADRGEVRCMGRDMRTLKAQSTPDIRYLTQHFSQYLELTVHENLEFFAAMRGVASARQAVNLAIRDFGLLAVRDARAQELSGGVRQRLMLAATLLGEPRIVLLDEPTAALDGDARRALWRLLDSRRTAAMTLIFTTHLDEDMAHCDAATRLREGGVPC